MSKFVRLTVRSTGLPLVINADLIESMIPMDGYTSIRMTGSVLGSTDHVLESVEQIEDQLLRDEFAVEALSGLLSSSGGVVQKNPMSGTGYVNGDNETVSAWAYGLADAMIKERVK